MISGAELYLKTLKFVKNFLKVTSAQPSRQALGRGVIEVKPRCLLHMAEAIAAEVFAAVPAGHDDQLIAPLSPFQHTQNDHPSAAFSIV